jgi:NAD(P)-dependent dehydrogenase (short-subunit alcohol dehydrogenase family)
VNDFVGRIALVTGASSGIGVGIARALANRGARVALVARDKDRLATVAESIRNEGGACLELARDIGADGAPEEVVQAVLTEWGAIDVLVNNAGIFRSAPLIGSDIKDLDDQYLVNVRAPYALTLAAAPHMPAGSSIVFITSNLARVGLKDSAAYCASKGAVEAMVRALALDLAPDIRVNAVAPGIIKTPMTARIHEDDDNEAAAIDKTPAGRLGRIEDIGAAVAYVASDDAGYMVGSTLTIDGGWNII